MRLKNRAHQGFAMKNNMFVFTTVFIILFCLNDAARFYEKRLSHTAFELSDNEITILSGVSNMTYFEEILDKILIPRVSGTPGNVKVRKFIIKELEELGMTVSTDRFTDTVPIFGKIEFENIVAKLNPDAPRFLVLACHYDSKYFANEEFLGATDSAVPCAMMINVVKVLKPYLKTNTQVSLALIFFDGEEAFQTWGPKDSIYGARHLAEKWGNTLYPKNNKDSTTELHRIDMLVLLDLLGAPDPTFYSFFANTERWYVRLINAENRLSDQRHFQRYSNGRPQQQYFKARSQQSGIEDDHLPFLRRNVPILHLIQTPFPEIWHTLDDNKAALDMSTIDNLNKILRVFVAEYLHLDLTI